MNKPIESLVIVGGGTAGWMAAAYLAKKFKGTSLRITLVESADIGTIGVGEATVPSIKLFFSELGIDEKEFIQATNATFKLGIEFEGWLTEGSRFFHPFGPFGERIASVDFYHYWTHARQQGVDERLDSFSFPTQMARQGKFAIPRPTTQGSDLANFNYAYHFDAGLFARYLRHYAQQQGVTAITATVASIKQRESDGAIQSIVLDDGREIAGEFFVDCTGFAGLLIEKTLNTGYEDWSHWLPCDSALACQTEKVDEAVPYTRSIAMNSGWRWQIPLQNRLGNGYVFSSQFISREQAETELLSVLESKPLTSPRLLNFKTGLRKKTWHKNVFAIGLSSGFLEPLESTSIYMIQLGLASLYENFPFVDHNPSLENRVNRLLRDHTERLRDFIILHYCLNQRHNMVFWDYCRQISLPDSLAASIDEYMSTGSIRLGEIDFFKLNSWLAVLAGLDKVPQRYHPKVSNAPLQDIVKEFSTIKMAIGAALTRLPGHETFLGKL